MKYRLNLQFSAFLKANSPFVRFTYEVRHGIHVFVLIHGGHYKIRNRDIRIELFSGSASRDFRVEIQDAKSTFAMTTENVAVLEHLGKSTPVLRRIVMGAIQVLSLLLDGYAIEGGKRIIHHSTKQ